MEPAYYQEYFRNEREHWWFRAREKILRAQVRRLVAAGLVPEAAKILNIGAATGRSSEWLGEFGEVVSLEYDGDCCRLTREATGLAIDEGSILELPYGAGSFDLVCAFDVIEHVEDDGLAVAEVRRVVREGGVVFVTVPAYRWLWGEHDEINHHHRRYGMRELRGLFGEGYELWFSSGFNSLLLAPIAAHRVVRGLLGGGGKRRARAARSDFGRGGGRVVGGVLERVFGAERLWLDRGLGMPVGVSLMVVAVREGKAGGR